MKHTNKAPFIGVLTRVDAPSDTAPSGARGHRVLLTKDAAVKAMDSLIGMALNYKPSWDGHDARCKIGIIESAELVRDEIIVTGFLYARDFPEVIKQLSATADYGMSYEMADTRCEDMRAEILEITRTEFTGAAIVLREKAAYKMTDFLLID